MIVLHEHDRGGAVDFLEDGFGELRVDARILFPVARVENGARIGDVTQRPQRAVGETVVVAFFLFRSEPDAPQRIGRLVRRHRQATRVVRRLMIAAAAAMSDPHAAGGAHDRIERGNQTARRTIHFSSPPRGPTRL